MNPIPRTSDKSPYYRSLSSEFLEISAKGKKKRSTREPMNYVRFRAIMFSMRGHTETEEFSASFRTEDDSSIKVLASR